MIEALFPVSPAERELFAMTPEMALRLLPPAPPYDHVMPDTYSVFAYKDERVSKLVWNVKYKKMRHAVMVGGYAVWELASRVCEENVSRGTSASADAAARSRPQRPPKVPSNSFSSSTLLIPIPITARRRKERGYNQCELLLDEIERLAKRDKQVGHFLFEKNLLLRTQHKSRQTLKGRAERLESAKGIFGVDENVVREYEAKLPDFKHIPVILIDDVITTGTTITEARETLVKAGFTRVSVISLAH